MNSAESIYGKEYAEKYKHLASTALGNAIYFARWALIKRFVSSGVLLDFGCGPGAFVERAKYATDLGRFQVHQYDINPTCGFTELPKEPVDVLTMWDSIEHVPNYYGLIQQINPQWLFITTPNLESVVKPIGDWKHYRRREHIYYFDRHSLGVILEDLGYKILEFNYDEGKLRDPEHPDAILTVVARKAL